MVRVGVVSDSHGDQAALRRAAAGMGDVQLILHAGDFHRDGLWLGSVTGIPVEAVAGNCDGAGAGPTERVVDVGGMRILLTHGHLYAVKYNYSHLYRRALELGAACAVFGHTHRPDAVREGPVLLFNPGAAGGGTAEATFGILRLDAGANGNGVSAEIHALRGKSGFAAFKRS